MNFTKEQMKELRNIASPVLKNIEELELNEPDKLRDYILELERIIGVYDFDTLKALRNLWCNLSNCVSEPNSEISKNQFKNIRGSVIATTVLFDEKIIIID